MKQSTINLFTISFDLKSQLIIFKAKRLYKSIEKGLEW